MLYCFARRVTNTSQALTRRRYLPRTTRRGVRVAEGARLESVFSRNRDVGSNPTLSAILRQGFGWQAITYFGMWYVYILRSKADGKLYVGSTADLRRRLQAHRESQSMNKGFIAKTSIIINCPIAKVWDALTNPDIIRQYMFGTNVI